MKAEYVEVYDNSSDEFDIEHCRFKGKGHCRCSNIPNLIQYKLSGPIT